MKLKFISKFNHDYLQIIVWKALCDFEPIDDGPFFEAAHGLGGPKMPPPQNMSYISYNDDTWYSYTLPKENP